MKLLYWSLLFFLVSLDPVFAREFYQAHTHVRLVSEQDTVLRGGTLWVGFDFIMDDGWHIYWQNPGDSGLSPRIKWNLPLGIKAGDINWPYPKRLNVGPLTSFGYEHEVLLLVPVTVAGDFQSSKNVNIHARLDWLACQDMCMPGRSELNLSLPLVQNISGVTFNGLKDLFDQNRRNLPQSIDSIISHATLDGDKWLLDIKTPLTIHEDIVFYPFRDDVIEHAAPQQTQITGNGYQLILKKSHIYHGALTSIEGIAVNPEGWDETGRAKALLIQAPIEVALVHVTFLIACLFALIGGLILNLMPCVLPVLSIKVLNLVERHSDSRQAFRHSLVYAFDISVSVWSLALLLFILKSAGQLVGWGFQFQSPVFVIIVALILFFLALNLFGVFEFVAPTISGLGHHQVGLTGQFYKRYHNNDSGHSLHCAFYGNSIDLWLKPAKYRRVWSIHIFRDWFGSAICIIKCFPVSFIFYPQAGSLDDIFKKVLWDYSLGNIARKNPISGPSAAI